MSAPDQRPPSPLLAVALLLTVGAALSVWAVRESRLQRRNTEDALRTQARLVAEALGPALANAATSVRELEELLTWKLLDNAVLLADGRPVRSDAELEEIVRLNGLRSLVWLDRDAHPFRQLGEPLPSQLLMETAAEVARGQAQEALLGSVADPATGAEIAAVAVSRPTGGALVVAATVDGVLAFSRETGLRSLLESMMDTEALLYLAYAEQPEELGASVVWDGGSIPELEDGTVGFVRERRIFAVEIPVDAPAGVVARLRVGLDAEPLTLAADAAWRRTLLVALSLAAVVLLVFAVTLVQRARARERRQSRIALAELERRRMRSEQLAAAGTLAAGLAHEVRNPLNAISLAAQRIERRVSDETASPSGVRELAVQTRAEVEKLDKVLNGFLELARPSGPDRSLVDLRTLADDVVGFLSIEAGERRIGLSVEGSETEATVDEDAVRRALVNLVRNAVQASPSGGAVNVKVGLQGDHARIEVLDEGPGLGEEASRRAFEAFFTGRAGGTGLGLSIVQRIAHEHGGRARLEQIVGGGCRALLDLPLGESPAGGTS